MKKLLLIAFILLQVQLFAAKYYVSLTGSDSNNGLSEFSPWQTITKVNGFSFAAGDSVLFKGGETWSYSGASSPYRLSLSVGNVYIGSYGTGHAEFSSWVEIAGWQTSGNWSLYATNVYRMSLVNFPNRLWLNGKDSYRSANLAGINSTNRWRWESNYLYVYATSNPATYYNSIKSGNEQDRVIGIGRSGITLDNVKVTGGNNCIFITKSDVTVKNCTIGDKVNLGGIKIWCQTPGDSVNNVQIFGNRLLTGDSLTYTYLKDPHSTGDAIQIGDGTTNCKVHHNYFERWSHVGVYMYAPSATYPFHGNEVYSNFITSPVIDYARAFCVDHHSGGYNNSIHDNTAYDMSIGNQLNGNGLKFYNNIIDGIRAVSYMGNLVGNGFGASAYATPATNMEIYNNTFRNCYDSGILMNDYGFDNSGNNIHDNNIINCIDYQIYIYNVAGVHDNTYTNNHIYAGSNPVIYYEGAARTISAWNDYVTDNGDSISGNDAVLKWGTITESDVSNIAILHNYTASPQLLSAGWPGIDVATGHQKSTYFSVPAYSSVILIKNIPNPTGTKKPAGKNGVMYKTLEGLPIGVE